MMTSQAVEEKVRAGSARRRAAKPHLIYVYKDFHTFFDV